MNITTTNCNASIRIDLARQSELSLSDISEKNSIQSGKRKRELAKEDLPKTKFHRKNDLSIENLPNEILAKIFTHLPPLDLYKVPLLNKRFGLIFQTIISTPSLSRGYMRTLHKASELLIRKFNVKNDENKIEEDKKHLIKNIHKTSEMLNRIVIAFNEKNKSKKGSPKHVMLIKRFI